MSKKHGSSGHNWSFFRAGGFDQVMLSSGRDLLELDKLDQKLWVALACPVDNVHFDSKTLSYLDSNGDRRIRAMELISAVKWVASQLKNPDDLIGENRTFHIDQINRETEEGSKLYDSAKNALVTLGKKESDPLTVADVESLGLELAKKAFNGDGVITSEVSEDEAVKKIIEKIIESTGGTDDRSGKPGINSEKVESFFDQAQKYLAWAGEPENDKSIKVLGDDTLKASEAVKVVREKIEDYFARCAIAIFDERATVALNGGDKPFEQISSKDSLSVNCAEISRLPISPVGPQKPLSFASDVNPAWAADLKTFKTEAVDKLLGPQEVLTEEQWRGILDKFGPFFSWQDRKPTKIFDSTEITEVRDIAGSVLKEKLLALIDQDKTLSSTFDSIKDLDKLVRFHRDIYSLCNNFVNFKELYNKESSAVFMAGTLYLDQRTCRLCMKIDDIAKHSAMAAMAGTFLAYCECKRHDSPEKMTIVAAFTNGDSENLMVGRNGIFYDRLGRDWDATIVKIIENPISLRQAFWLPYKNFVRMIESQVAKRASAAEAQTMAKMEQGAEVTAMADKAKAPPPQQKKIDVGTVAAIGVAAGAIGTFAATLLGYASGIIKLGPLAVIGAILALLLCISGPSLILAYIKLRKRNLGPILDASGWAVNAKALINVPFGTALTAVAVLPRGSYRNRTDPYAQKKSPLPRLLILALLFYVAFLTLNHFGLVNKWTDGKLGMKKETSISVEAPAKIAETVKENN